MKMELHKEGVDGMEKNKDEERQEQKDSDGEEMINRRRG